MYEVRVVLISKDFMVSEYQNNIGILNTEVDGYEMESVFIHG